jgi:hypothetical protein
MHLGIPPTAALVVALADMGPGLMPPEHSRMQGVTKAAEGGRSLATEGREGVVSWVVRV